MSSSSNSKINLGISQTNWSPESLLSPFDRVRDHFEAEADKRRQEHEEYMKSFHDKSSKLNPQNSQDALLKFEQFLSGIQPEEFQDDEESDGEGDEEFDDPDYNLSDSDEDFQEVISDHPSKKERGRPKKSKNNVPSTSGIVLPEINGNSNSDVDEEEELHERDFDIEDGEDKVTYGEYDEDKHKENPSLELGMKFRSLEQFKDACRNWGIKNRRQLHFPTNDTERVICKCKEPGCPFRLHASCVSKIDRTVQIKSCNLEHTGGNVFNNFHMTSGWLAKKYFDTFRADPTWSLAGFINTIKNDYNYTISKMRAWRAKNVALKWIHGDEGAQYAKLLSYRAELLQSNPGSSVELWRDEGRFLGFYVCLGALKEAFKSGCRPLISLDGCWLKGNYGGNLLTAVAIDPNDCIFPIAYAVIAEAESRETWSWFLENLGLDLEIRNSHHIAFMSDRQKGLIGAVKDLYPSAEHRNCVRHMYQNFRQKHKGKNLKDLVWNAARASNEVNFRKCMEDIENEDKEAREWFNHPERPFSTWTRSMFKIHTRCDMLLNNLCESFNRYILDARDKAIITMLEMIKNKLMRRMHTKRIWIDKFQKQICPKIEKKLIKVRNEGVMFKPDFSGGPQVLVEGPGGPFIVDLVRKTCTCRRWDLTGLPCPHAVVSILGNNERLEDFVVSYYHVKTYKNVYSYFINPTNHENYWPVVENGGEVIPPMAVKKKRGRKPKNRRKEAEEIEQQKKAEATNRANMRAKKRAEQKPHQKLSKKGNIVIRCSICKKIGHNARGHFKFEENGAQMPAQVATSSVLNPNQDGDSEGSNIMLTNRSTITEGPIQDFSASNEVVAPTTEVDYSSQLDVIQPLDVVVVSKRGRNVKRKIMSDFVVDAQKKKTREFKKN